MVLAGGPLLEQHLSARRKNKDRNGPVAATLPVGGDLFQGANPAVGTGQILAPVVDQHHLFGCIGRHQNTP